MKHKQLFKKERLLKYLRAKAKAARKARLKGIRSKQKTVAAFKHGELNGR